jgi:hypothetical protein
VEISSDTVHPVFNEDMKTLWKKSDDRSIVKQIKRHEGSKKYDAAHEKKEVSSNPTK